MIDFVNHEEQMEPRRFIIQYLHKLLKMMIASFEIQNEQIISNLQLQTFQQENMSWLLTYL